METRQSSLAFVPLLIDIAVVVMFSLGGMVFHDLRESVMSDFFRISSPFFVGILSCGWAFGGYDHTASVGTFAKHSSLALGFGLVSSFGLRAIQRGEAPLFEFLLPAVLFFVLLTSALKSLYWWASQKLQK